MNFKYIDYYRCKYKSKVKEIYINSFPKNERFPFWILKNCSKKGNVLFNAILDNDKIIGMEYIIKYDKDTAYLMYLAINENKRGKGYGSKLLGELAEKYKTIILSIERPNKDFEESKEKRKKFYLKNGFYETNKFIQDNGVEYEILCTNKNYDVTKEDLEKRYTKMTKSFLMRYLIGKIFNMNNIDIEEEENI